MSRSRHGRGRGRVWEEAQSYSRHPIGRNPISPRGRGRYTNGFGSQPPNSRPTPGADNEMLCKYCDKCPPPARRPTKMVGGWRGLGKHDLICPPCFKAREISRAPAPHSQRARSHHATSAHVIACDPFRPASENNRPRPSIILFIFARAPRASAPAGGRGRRVNQPVGGGGGGGGAEIETKDEPLHGRHQRPRPSAPNGTNLARGNNGAPPPHAGQEGGAFACNCPLVDGRGGAETFWPAPSVTWPARFAAAPAVVARAKKGRHKLSRDGREICSPSRATTNAKKSADARPSPAGQVGAASWRWPRRRRRMIDSVTHGRLGVGKHCLHSCPSGAPTSAGRPAGLGLARESGRAGERAVSRNLSRPSSCATRTHAYPAACWPPLHRLAREGAEISAR